jgi:hypothetical protein
MIDPTERLEQALPPAAARRLSNQIARAYRGTYGAETGLRAIVRQAGRQMLLIGWSPDTVMRVLEQHIREHPATRAADARTRAPGRLTSGILIDLTRQCMADLAHDAQIR